LKVEVRHGDGQGGVVGDRLELGLPPRKSWRAASGAYRASVSEKTALAPRPAMNVLRSCLTIWEEKFCCGPAWVK
jgi:hypothetical protein